jgi:hypothetical protein
VLRHQTSATRQSGPTMNIHSSLSRIIGDDRVAKPAPVGQLAACHGPRAHFKFHAPWDC